MAPITGGGCCGHWTRVSYKDDGDGAGDCAGDGAGDGDDDHAGDGDLASDGAGNVPVVLLAIVLAIGT